MHGHMKDVKDTMLLIANALLSNVGGTSGDLERTLWVLHHKLLLNNDEVHHLQELDCS